MVVFCLFFVVVFLGRGGFPFLLFVCCMFLLVFVVVVVCFVFCLFFCLGCR